MREWAYRHVVSSIKRNKWYGAVRCDIHNVSGILVLVVLNTAQVDVVDRFEK